MITLLMALFMVLFSISSTNVSKFKALSRSLHQAFSGKVLPGGEALMNAGGSDVAKLDLNVTPKLTPAQRAAAQAKAQMGEQQAFHDLKREIDAEVRREGLTGKVTTRVTARGLAIIILTDGLLFRSGEATVRPGGLRLLDRLAPLLRRESAHQLVVQGHTDSVPIRTAIYPSNWELSTARASAVVRALLHDRVAPQRLEASGRADLDPVASDAGERGRQRNRRVEILLPRLSSSSSWTVPTP